MSFAIVASLMAAGTAVSTYGQIQAGKAAEEQAIEQARQEKIAAEGRELQRRQELNKVLASNIAGASMSGIAGEGTPASIALESAKAVGTSEGMIGLSEKLKRRQIRMQGKMDKGTAYTQATSTLLKGAADAYGGFMTYQENKPKPTSGKKDNG